MIVPSWSSFLQAGGAAAYAPRVHARNAGLKFGVQTPPQHTDWPSLRDAWRLVDSLGYDSAWVFDHFVPIFSDPTGPCLEGWTLLAALGAETRSVEVGVLVTGNTYRHPAVLAKMAATVDHTTGGRLLFGIGAAWFETEHRMYGIPFPPVGERVSRLGEALEVIRRLWTEAEASFEGRFYRLDKARCEPKPVQRPHPPIMIGGGGEKRMLRLVARHADMWNWFGPVDDFRRKIAILRDHCAAVGRDPAAIEITWAGAAKVLPAGGDRRAALETIAKAWGQTPDEVDGRSLVGTADRVAERVRAYADLGVRHLILSTVGGFDAESITRFAQEVAPRFR